MTTAHNLKLDVAFTADLLGLQVYSWVLLFCSAFVIASWPISTRVPTDLLLAEGLYRGYAVIRKLTWHISLRWLGLLFVVPRVVLLIVGAIQTELLLRHDPDLGPLSVFNLAALAYLVGIALALSSLNVLMACRFPRSSVYLRLLVMLAMVAALSYSLQLGAIGVQYPELEERQRLMELAVLGVSLLLWWKVSILTRQPPPDFAES